MTTLNLKEAAALLKIHPVTLQDKARAGEIPGAKIGRAWVFIEIDLFEYIRSKCPRRALQGDSSEVSVCHSELGGWELADMVRKYAHLSTVHLTEYVDRVSSLRLVVSEGVATNQLHAQK